LVSWDVVPGAVSYNIRLNGTLVDTPAPITATYYAVPDTEGIPGKGTRYTVSAVYSGGEESHPSRPLIIDDVAHLPSAPADGEDKSGDILGEEVGITRPTTWDLQTLSSQGVDYYIFPVDSMTPYYIWWADSSNGGAAESATLNITVNAAWYGRNDVPPVVGTGGYGTVGITITSPDPDYTGYIVLTVRAQTPPATGDYRIGYTY
jgi:hypothetical protein